MSRQKHSRKIRNRNKRWRAMLRDMAVALHKWQCDNTTDADYWTLDTIPELIEHLEGDTPNPFVRRKPKRVNLDRRLKDCITSLYLEPKPLMGDLIQEVPE